MIYQAVPEIVRYRRGKEVACGKGSSGGPDWQSLRRKHLLIGTYDANEAWKYCPIKSEEDLTSVKALKKAALEGRQ